MQTETLVVRAEYTTLDLLLWRRFRREIDGLVEDTYTRNPGLAELGVVFLPLGTKVVVASPPPEPRGRVAVQVVSLFE